MINEAAMAEQNVKLKLKDTEEKLQSAKKCENNHVLLYRVVLYNNYYYCDINCDF